MAEVNFYQKTLYKFHVSKIELFVVVKPILWKMFSISQRVMMVL